MKRDLLKQIKNEWRENVWLLLELLIVMLALWFFCVQFYVEYNNYRYSQGADIRNVYFMFFKNIDWRSPDFIDFGEEETQKNREDMIVLLQRMRNNPNVEAAGFSINGMPYEGSFQGRHIDINDGDTIPLYVNSKFISPDLVDVLRLESTNGFSRQDMKDALGRGKVLLGSNPEFDSRRDIKKFLGKQIFGLTGDSTKRMVANILIKPIRNSRFDRPEYGTAIRGIDEAKVASGEGDRPWSLVVRIKPGCEEAFFNDYSNDNLLSRSRNIYLNQPYSLEAQRDSMHRRNLMSLRLKAGGSICLLIMVFLGLSGTFRYRVRRRESEIAIRKVNGATSGDIFRRFITEGILLLCLAAVLAVGIVIILYCSDIIDHINAVDISAGGIFSFLFMLLIIVTAISIPAKLAMQIKPAEALKSE